MLHTKRQKDVINFYLSIRAYAQAADTNSASWKAASAAFGNGQLAITSYYNFLLDAAAATRNLARTTFSVAAPPGLEDLTAEFDFAMTNRADGYQHLAKFLNTGDLEEQRKAGEDLKEADDAIVALVAGFFLALDDAGLSFEVTELVQCDDDSQSCTILSPADPASIFKD